jgi:hypothetical protein
MQVSNGFRELFAKLLGRVHVFGLLFSSIQVELKPLF